MKTARLYNIYHSLLTALVMASATLFISSCDNDKDDPVPEVAQEEADGWKLTFTKLDHDGALIANDTTVVRFDDEGHPTPHHLHLTEGETYRLSIDAFYKGKSVKQEFIDEGDIHQFFFTGAPDGVFEYTYKDQDKNGRGIGLEGELKVLSATATGFDWTITLSHGLNKASTHAQTWNSATFRQAGGATDFEASLDMHPVEGEHHHDEDEHDHDH